MEMGGIIAGALCVAAVLCVGGYFLRRALANAHYEVEEMWRQHHVEDSYPVFHEEDEAA